jgi:hypothetical protein
VVVWYSSGWQHARLSSKHVEMGEQHDRECTGSGCRGNMWYDVRETANSSRETTLQRACVGVLTAKRALIVAGRAWIADTANTTAAGTTRTYESSIPPYDYSAAATSTSIESWQK